MAYCPDCRHFIYCDPYKILDYKIHNIECEEFEEREAKMTIGQKMRKAREVRKMSKVKLAEITGISYNTLASYERGDTEPCLSYAVKIADALGISLNYLARDRK